jgi:hypothetical protein
MNIIDIFLLVSLGIYFILISGRTILLYRITAVRFNHNKPSRRGWSETILSGGGL